MRIAIVGLGAVGGLTAAMMARAGIEVCALARGATLEAVRRDGIRLIERGPEGERQSAFPLQVADTAQALGPVDLVMVSVKAPALPQIADAVAALLGPETAILSAMQRTTLRSCEMNNIARPRSRCRSRSTLRI